MRYTGHARGCHEEANACADLAGGAYDAARLCLSSTRQDQPRQPRLTAHGGQLTALQTAIDGFKAIVSKPRDNITAGKTVTQQLSDEFDGADETLSEILDGLIGQFSAANAKFVSDYQNARTIVDASASHASPNPPTPAPTPAAPKP